MRENKANCKMSVPNNLQHHCFVSADPTEKKLVERIVTFSIVHSLEVRVPLLDHQLMGLLAYISGADKIDPHTTNICLLRQ